MRFYLGTHEVSWLGRTDAPLFVSRRRLVDRATLPRTNGPWALDSGGFTELSLHGRWTVEPERYADEVRALSDGVGRPDFAAIQDWMCEPHVLEKTKLTVEEHQRRTVASYLRLRELAPEVTWAPVLQGWSLGDYERHADAYAKSGVRLADLPVVGLGTVCRRQNTLSASLLLTMLAWRGLRNLHGFGFKVSGLTSAAETSSALGQPFPLASADSLAWSFHARREPPLPECSHKRCNNCLPFALEWRGRLLEKLEKIGRR